MLSQREWGYKNVTKPYPHLFDFYQNCKKTLYTIQSNLLLSSSCSLVYCSYFSPSLCLVTFPVCLKIQSVSFPLVSMQIYMCLLRLITLFLLSWLCPVICQIQPMTRQLSLISYCLSQYDVSIHILFLVFFFFFFFLVFERVSEMQRTSQIHTHTPTHSSDVNQPSPSSPLPPSCTAGKRSC